MKAILKIWGKWYFLSKNSQWEVWSTVSSDINDSLAGISDFSEDIVSETGSDSGSISSHDGSKSDTDSNYNSEPLTSAISSSFNRKEQSCSYTFIYIYIYNDYPQDPTMDIAWLVGLA